MKKFNKLFFFFLFTTVCVFAQSPEKMSYQAVIRDATNTLVTNQSVGMQISILQTTTTGTAVYTETQTVTTNTNGLVSLEIGMGDTSDDFSAIDWSAGPYFIKTETDPMGGDTYSIIGTSQLLSVPFALYATTSESSETNATNIVNNTTFIETNTTAIALNTAKVGITAQQALDITSNNVKTGITTVQSDAIEANTLKVGYTEALVSANTDVAANTLKVGYTEALVSANTDVAANTLKVGYTEALVSANTDVAANTLKVGYTEALVSANTDVAANTLKVGYTEALVSANTDVAANTLKVGYTEALVSANTDVAANTLKVGYTEALVSANTDVAANTAKVTNATHTGDVTGSTALTIANDAVTTDKILDANVTDAKIATVSALKLTGAVGILNGGTNITTYTQGDILYATSAGVLTKLPKGTAGQILTMNTGATAPEWVNSETTTYSIGDFAHGGIVFWVDETGKHGLVCAKVDQSAPVRWNAGTNGSTFAKGVGVYSGKANTEIIILFNLIIGDDSNPYAARICNETQITEGGKTYDDWYLPSIYELTLMHQNKTTINTTASANGGSDLTTHYWSSTESQLAGALGLSFIAPYDGIVFETNKTYAGVVRAVRAF